MLFNDYGIRCEINHHIAQNTVYQPIIYQLTSERKRSPSITPNMIYGIVIVDPVHRGANIVAIPTTLRRIPMLRPANADNSVIVLGEKLDY